MSDDVEHCTCGCGLTRRQAVSEVAHKLSLNEEQADALFARAQKIRKEQEGRGE